MKMVKGVITAAALSAALVSAPALAAPYQSSAALPATTTTLTFDGPTAEFAPVTDQYAGVTFAGLSQQYAYGVGDFSGINGGSLGNYQDGVSEFLPGVINFNSAVSGAAFNFVSNSGTTVFSSFLNGSLVETASLFTSTDGRFTGFQNSIFDRIVIDASATGNGVFTFDNLSFTTAVAAVPEPATWALMLVGFGMIGATARYRRRYNKIVYA